MPKGITVLYKKEILELSFKYLEISGIVFILYILLIITSLTLAVKSNKSVIKTISPIFTFIGVLVIIIDLILFIFDIPIPYKYENTGKYTYIVTINNDANFKEIYDKYYIINHKGKIYTISDK